MTGSADFLVWKSGARRYGLEIKLCREVVNAVSVTAIPGFPAYLSGVTNLRGSVIAVLDLDVLLGFGDGAQGESAAIIRIRGEGYPCALRAESILDAVPIGAEQIEAAPANLGEAQSGLIRRVARHGENLILIPDIPAILEKFPVTQRSSHA